MRDADRDAEVGDPAEANEPSDARSGLTLRLVDDALRIRHHGLPADVERVARDCLLDWLGCAVAGLDEPVARIVRECALQEGGAAQSTLLGAPVRVGASQAALANGTASHALDYDDVNLTLPGHVCVAVVPAVLALAEQRGSSLAEVIAAFVAGYETACRIGALVAPAHYANGYHATATIGGLGAAVACSHLLRLSTIQTAHAVGVAATQAAGLKAMFGSMAKPLHAGLAAQAGLRAALFAQRGFVARTDSLECSGGFAATHGSAFDAAAALATPPGGFHLLANLFKFHAACFSTHSTIEATAGLRGELDVEAAEVAQIRVVADACCSICNLSSPTDALGAKFSLRAAAAFALLGIDTGRLDSWERVTEGPVREVMQRVQVELVPGDSLSRAAVSLVLGDGRSFRREIDCGVPLADKLEQSRRVADKFVAVVAPVIGADRCARTLGRLRELAPDEAIGTVLELCRRSCPTAAPFTSNHATQDDDHR